MTSVAQICTPTCMRWRCCCRAQEGWATLTRRALTKTPHRSTARCVSCVPTVCLQRMTLRHPDKGAAAGGTGAGVAIARGGWRGGAGCQRAHAGCGRNGWARAAGAPSNNWQTFKLCLTSTSATTTEGWGRAKTVLVSYYSVNSTTTATAPQSPTTSATSPAYINRIHETAIHARHAPDTISGHV